MKKLFYSLIIVAAMFATMAPGGGNPGAIWTTNGGCGPEQNVNQYPSGSNVYVNGSDFDAGTYNWEVKEPGANGAVLASGTVTPDGDGNFCIDAGSPPDGGPYQVNVGNKNDNFSINNGDPGTQVCTDEAANNTGGPLPCTYDPQLCTDEAANNEGEPLPCTYDPQLCTDEAANNEGEPLPCTYDSGVCEDEAANNEGEPLPCTYDPQLCTDEAANNTGEALPCTYDPQLCTDEAANNTGEALPCTYDPLPPPEKEHYCWNGKVDILVVVGDDIPAGAVEGYCPRKGGPTWNCGDRFNPDATRKSSFWEWYTKHGRGYRCLGEQSEGSDGWRMGADHRGWFNPQWRNADK
jgi:hypothetical protein